MNLPIWPAYTDVLGILLQNDLCETQCWEWDIMKAVKVVARTKAKDLAHNRIQLASAGALIIRIGF